MTETANRISTDKDYRKAVAGTVFVSGKISEPMYEGDNKKYSGSVVLDQLESGESKGIKVKTFLKFFEEMTGDKGRDYFGISPVEDYMLKMTATNMEK